MTMAKNMYVAFGTVILAAVISVVYGEDLITEIKTEEDFKEFCNIVNNGISNYSSTTVFLNASLNFNGSTIKPVGNNTNNPFRGTFDGQGHTISNFTINTKSKYAGLFGYVQGATIKNVTLGESCSVTSTASGSQLYIGGVCGYCKGECNISGCVNKANITYSGNNENYLGGIIGYCNTGDTNNIFCRLENNINYGSISYDGTQKSNEITSRLGGIAGKAKENTLISGCMNFGAIYGNLLNQEGRVGGIVGVFNEDDCTISNSVNYGEISIHGKSKNFKVGGIAGNFGEENSYIQSCYNFGTINNTCKCSEESYIGGIAGGGEDGKITGCISDGMIEDTSSSGELSIGAICAEEPSIISDCYFNKSICNGLSECTDSNKGSSYNESFYINGTNKTLSDIVGTSQSMITNAGGFTLTLNANCESTTTISTKFIIFPSTVQLYNDSDYSTLFNVTSLDNDTIIYGRIEIYSGAYGSFSSSSSLSSHTSSSSFSSSTAFTSSTSSSTTPISPTDNATEYVKIVFNKKDLTEKEISEIITEIATGNFAIEKMNTEGNNLMVIVKFENAETARNFVEFIEGTGNENISYAMFMNDPFSLASIPASIPKAIVYFFSLIYLLKR